MVSPDLIMHAAKKQKKEGEPEVDDGIDDREIKNGMFLPMIERSNKILVYVKIQYQGLERDVIYNHRELPQMTLPNDLFDD